MKITNWWPLFFLLLIPIIVFMYLLKQKAQDKEVSSLFLFREMYANIEANTPWEKLKKNWLMILQIITTCVLIFALMSPLIVSKGLSADHEVIVIDNSAGMSSKYSDSETRLDYAKSQAISLVKGMHSGTTASLITSSDTATLLISSSDDKNQIIKKIEEIEPTLFEGDASEGVSMVESMRSQWESLETVVFTDTNVSLNELDGYVVDVYKDCKNVSIDYVSHGESNNKLVVLAKVSNYSKEETVAEVSLYGDDTLLTIKSVTIEPESSEVVYFDDLSFTGEILKAELSGTDDLKDDNVCYDIIGKDEVIDILLMTDANVYLENALSIIEGVNITKSGDIDSFSGFASQGYDLYIFDSMMPGQLPADGNIIIFNAPCDLLYESKDNLGGVSVETVENEITAYMDDFSFGVSDTRSFTTPNWADEFLVAGNNTVAFSGEYNSQIVTVFGFDLHNSDLPLKMEFPLMMYNLISRVSQTGLVRDTIVTAGNSVTLNARMDGDLPIVVNPAGEESEMSDFRMNYTGTEQMGVYNVNQNYKGQLLNNKFVVNFPSMESFVEFVPTSLETEDAETVKSKVGGTLNLRTLIILISLGLLGVEWIAYLKR